MPASYTVIEIYTSEGARCKERPLVEAVVDRVQRARAAARCLVFKAVAGGYEDGEVASRHLEVLSYNMPVKIEIVLPTAECERLLGELVPLVTDGVVMTREAQVCSYRVRTRLIPRQLRARDVMTAPAVSVTQSTPVPAVIRLLLSAAFNAVPVVDTERRPVGIIAQGDLIARANMPIRLGLLAELESAQVDEYLTGLGALTAADVMTAPVVTVAAELPLDEVVRLMLRHGLKRFPVSDEQGKLAGMLARLDVFGAVVQRVTEMRALTSPADVATVGEIMGPKPGTVSPRASGAEVLQLLRSRGLQRVAVVDDQDHLLGLITDLELLTALAGRRSGVWQYLAHRGDLLRAAEDTTAGQMMKATLVTVAPDTPLAQAIELMTQQALKRLPVVDAEGKLVGMLSRQAILAAQLPAEE